MSNNVHWVLELNINDGALAGFKKLMAEMVTATQANEPGALDYEWLLSEDGTICHIYERYADSGAAMIHLTTFGEKFAGRFLALVSPTRLTVYGPASAEVRGAMAGLGAVHMSQIGGFTR